MKKGLPKPVFRDKADRMLEPGDLIVYGHALGRCAGLQYGKVIEVKWGRSKWTEEPVPRLLVQGVDDGYDDKPHLMSKKGTLQFEGRVLKLWREQVPKKHLALLDSVKVEP